MEKIPRAGVGVIIVRDGKVLLGKRKNAHGIGTWCPPGGHLEFMETIEDCAIRETLEEAGVMIKNIQKSVFSEDFFMAEGKHYITFLVTAKWCKNEPQVLESDKFEEWNWFLWDDLPSPLFLSLQNHIKQGYDPFKI